MSKSSPAKYYHNNKKRNKKEKYKKSSWKISKRLFNEE